MKKILLAFVAMLCIAGASFAQTKPAAKAKEPVKTAAAKPAPTTKPAVAVKKDGTPDMRHKANKEAAAAKPAGPVKKDGTPDMRFKANKAAAPSKKKA